MVFSRVLILRRPLLNVCSKEGQQQIKIQVRNATESPSGALKPKPEQMPFGLIGVICAVVPGLFVGAAISKSVANFLEENDLFVPSEDDDDED